MEIHGYTQLGSIDATIDGIRMTVPDDMGNRHRRMIAEWEAEGNTIQPYEPPAPGPYQLFRSTFVARMDPDEAEALESAMLAEGAKLRLLYQSVDYFMSNDILFDVLHMTVAMTLSVDGETPNMARADELLAPES